MILMKKIATTSPIYNFVLCLFSSGALRWNPNPSEVNGMFGSDCNGHNLTPNLYTAFVPFYSYTLGRS